MPKKTENLSLEQMTKEHPATGGSMLTGYFGSLVLTAKYINDIGSYIETKGMGGLLDADNNLGHYVLGAIDSTPELLLGSVLVYGVSTALKYVGEIAARQEYDLQ